LNKLIIGLVTAVIVVFGLGFYFQQQSSVQGKQATAYLQQEAQKDADRAKRLQELKSESDAILRKGEHTPASKPVIDPEQVRAEQKAYRDKMRKMQYDAEYLVEQSLKDPDSAEFRDQHGPCGYVNSKNSFGGYTGFKRYAYNGMMVVIEGENMSSQEMDKVWKAIC